MCFIRSVHLSIPISLSYFGFETSSSLHKHNKSQSVREGDVVQRGLINLNAQLRTEHVEKRVDVDDKNRTVRMRANISYHVMLVVKVSLQC